MSRSRVARAYIAAFTGIGAAIYYILLWLPGIPILGLPNIKMEIGAALAPLIGIILGPSMGFIGVLVGNTIKSLYPFSPHGIPFIICAPVSAYATALLISRRWRIPVLILASILVASLFTPPFYPVTDYWQVYLFAYFDKIAALILIPIALDLMTSTSASRRYIGLYLTMFIGREFDKALGCFIFSLPIVYRDVFGIKKLSTVRTLYMMSPLYYLVVYLVEALVTFIVAIPIIKALLKTPGIGELLHVKKVREQKIL